MIKIYSGIGKSYRESAFLMEDIFNLKIVIL
jgi:hypothetical protein